MKDLCTLFEEAAEHITFFIVDDTSTIDIPFNTALEIAEEKCKHLLSDVNDETHSF